ncbi:hypothetical protein SRHO_G00154060 [Serrasalmus rhombeus]
MWRRCGSPTAIEQRRRPAPASTEVLEEQELLKGKQQRDGGWQVKSCEERQSRFSTLADENFHSVLEKKIRSRSEAMNGVLSRWGRHFYWLFKPNKAEKKISSASQSFHRAAGGAGAAEEISNTLFWIFFRS